MIDQALVDAFDNDWEAIRAHRVAGRPAEEVLASVRSDPDGVLGRLIGLVQAGDELAGRVVLRAMLPKLILMSTRERAGSFGDCVAQFWVQLAGYPLQRRPRRIAANLVWDTRKALQRESGRGRIVEVLTFETDPVEPAADDDLSATVVLADARSLGLIDDVTATTLSTVYVEGLSSRDAAGRLGCSADVVRWRCSRAVRRLAGHATQLAAA